MFLLFPPSISQLRMILKGHTSFRVPWGWLRLLLGLHQCSASSSAPCCFHLILSTGVDPKHIPSCIQRACFWEPSCYKSLGTWILDTSSKPEFGPGFSTYVYCDREKLPNFSEASSAIEMNSLSSGSSMKCCLKHI